MRSIQSAAMNYDDLLHSPTPLECFIGIMLEFDHIPSSKTTIGSNQDFGLSIVNSLAKRFCGKTPEHYAMWSADTGTG